MHFLETNLDFEYELSQGRRPQARPLRQRLAAWANLLRLLPQGAQSALLGARVPAQGDRLSCWGWTPRLRALAPAHQAVPSAEAVARANAKDFSHALERALGCELPHARVVHTLEQARAWIEQTQVPWVIKHPLGVSGRDRVVGKPGQCEARTLRWLERTLPQTCCVAQPWVDVTTERSTQLMLHQDGTWELMGVLQLHTDNTGTFRGHVAHPPTEQPKPLQSPQQLAHIARAVHELGYHGPLGIDAIEGDLQGARVRAPILEINARWTFGHMALFAHRLAPEGVCVRWEHPKQGVPARPQLPILSKAATPGTYRLPEHIDPGHATRSLLHVL